MILDLWMQIIAAGLEEPIPEFRFHPTRKWKFDYAWEDRKVALEIEGQNSRQGGKWVYGGGRHNRPAGFEKDLEKYNAATLAGWRVFRVTTGMVKDGRALALLREVLGDGEK